MKYRWTIQELKEASDHKIINSLISERTSELNPYAPLNERLKKIDTDKIFGLLELLELILSQREILPMLIGLNSSLDDIIAERLRQ